MDIKSLDIIVEEFFDTGKLVLNEQNEPAEEEVIDYFAIVDNDINVTEFDEEDTSVEKYLTRNLTGDEKKRLEISNEQLIDYLKDNEKEIKFVSDEQKESTIAKICNVLNGKTIKKYIDEFDDNIKTVRPNATEAEIHNHFQEKNKDFCKYSNFLKDKCEESDTTKYIFKKCGKSTAEKKYGDKLFETKTLNEQSIDLGLVQIIDQKIKDAGNSVRRNPREALRLWKEALELYKEAGEPKILSDRINRVVNMINVWSELLPNTDTNDTNITNTDSEDTSTEIDSEEYEETSTEIDSEEYEETSTEIDSEEDEENDEGGSDNILDILKNKLSDDTSLDYGIWKITEVGNDLVTLKRENIRKNDLEKFLLLCDNFVLELPKKEFIENINEKNLQAFKNSFKEDKKIISGEDTLDIVKKIMLDTIPQTSGEQSLKQKGYDPKAKELMDKATLLSKYIIKEIAGKVGYTKNSKVQKTYDNLLNLMLKYTKHKFNDVTSDQKLEQLYHVVFDMAQLYDYARNNKIGIVDKKLKKLFDSDNDYSKIREVFIEVRKQNNKDYEHSFENKCNGEQYFTVESGGDESTIFDGTMLPEEFKTKNKGWNKYLESQLNSLTGDTFTITNIVDNLIQILLNKVNKYDIKTAREVTLTNIGNSNDTITLEEGSKIEVKYTKYENRNGYKDFILSEFLSLYKNTDINTVEGNQLDNYNNVIETMVTYLKNDVFGEEVLNSISSNTAGIFYQDYIFVPIDSLKIYWSTKGQRKTEKRISLRVKPVDKPQIYYWKEGNPNCNKKFSYENCDKEPGCVPDNLEESITNFFDTGNFEF